jgi:SAM-dependent methyltransferase
MRECSKSIQRRLTDSNFLRRYFVGHGVDIGGKPDPLMLYQEYFPLMNGVRTWDWEDGDAQYMKSLEDDCVDFVHSSHCLEHLVDPREGLRNWLRVVRPGGYMVVTVPDEDLYEQGVFPSEFNLDHNWTFTISKQSSWSSRSLNVLELVTALGATAEVLKVELLTSTYRFDLPRFDQTLTPVGECGIEFIIRKRPLDEISRGGRLRNGVAQPDREMRTHLNQYRDDMRSMKRSNANLPPFTNDSPV